MVVLTVAYNTKYLGQTERDPDVPSNNSIVHVAPCLSNGMMHALLSCNAEDPFEERMQ